jgi:predicted amidohydrolase
VKEITVSVFRMAVSSGAYENIGKVRSMAEEMDSADIFILPELWTGMCGTEESKAALDAVCRVCRDKGVYAVAGTMPWPCGGRPANRAWIINDAGMPFAHYDKAHLFSSCGEDKIFAAGNAPLIFRFRGATCSVMVSYDIMFPEYARCAGLAGGEIIFVPAGPPAMWGGAWEALVRSSAASSQAYVIACASSGAGLTHEAAFASIVATPAGDIGGLMDDGEGVLTSRLDMSEIYKCRKLRPLTRDRRPELYGLIGG